MHITPSNYPNADQERQIGRKYGMFIHFGINTFNDTEWSNGTLSVLSYKPTSIDTDQWARNAYQAGMNFIIFTAKHHDGFCMWDTAHTDYGVMSSTYKIDVVKALSESCKKYGIKLGLYYSLWDRHEPSYKNKKQYVEYMLKQLDELMDGRYGEIVELWLDGSWVRKSNEWGIERIYNKVKSLQPGCAVGVNHTIGRYNSRGISRFRYSPHNCKRGYPMRHFPSDFRLRDPQFPLPGEGDPKIYKHAGKEYYLPFEATICIRNMNNWFWDTKYTKDKLVSADFIAQKYEELTAQSNILVVNVAPNIFGVQEEEDINHLLKVAKRLGIERSVEA